LIYVYIGTPQAAFVPQIAYNLNTPLITSVGLRQDGGERKTSWIYVYPESVILENIKKVS